MQQAQQQLPTPLPWVPHEQLRQQILPAQQQIPPVQQPLNLQQQLWSSQQLQLWNSQQQQQ